MPGRRREEVQQVRRWRGTGKESWRLARRAERQVVARMSEAGRIGFLGLLHNGDLDLGVGLRRPGLLRPKGYAMCGWAKAASFTCGWRVEAVQSCHSTMYTAGQ